MTTFTPERKVSQTFSPVQTQHSSSNTNGNARPPTHDQIARRAYEIYVASGREQGHCTQNWVKAEQQLANQPSSSALQAEAGI